jgi:uridylate kinase
MDTTAIALCRDYDMPIRIYDMHRKGGLLDIVHGEQLGTLVEA